MVFEIIEFGNLPQKLKQQTLLGLHDAFSSSQPLDSFVDLFLFRQKEFGDSTMCLVKGGKVLGAITCRPHYSELRVVLRWAVPSKQFLSAEGLTVGLALHAEMEKIAASKRLRLRPSSPTKSGERFLKHLRGELPQKPRRRGPPK